MPCETGLARGLCRPGRCPTPRGVSCSTLVRHTAVSRSGQRPRQPGIWTCSLAGCSLGRGPYLELGRCRLSLFTIDRDRSEHRRLLHQGCHGVGLCDYQAGTGRGCGGLHSCRGPCLAAPSVEHPVLCRSASVCRSSGALVAGQRPEHWRARPMTGTGRQTVSECCASSLGSAAGLARTREERQWSTLVPATATATGRSWR